MEPPLPPPPPQRTTSQQQQPPPPPPASARAPSAAGHEATPPLPPPPEPEQMDSRVEQWVRQTSTERVVSTGAAAAENKELEKLAQDIAESVVENMERGGGSGSGGKAKREEYQEVSE